MAFPRFPGGLVLMRENVTHQLLPAIAMTTPTPPRQVLSVNVGRCAPLIIDGRSISTAIVKSSASNHSLTARIKVNRLGLEGDEQADPTVHGGINKAVYAYPHEHFTFWQTVRAQAQVAGWQDPVPFGLMGENLTLTGLLEADAWVGDVLKFPDCELVISEPRYPCYKFEARMFRQASKLMAQSGFCGFYLSVRQPGTIAAGDVYDIMPGSREVSIRELFTAKMKKRQD